MQLIDDGTQGPATFPTKNAAVGPPGYPNTLPGSQTPSRWQAEVAATIMAEIINVVLASGQSLDRTNNAQLLAALRLLFGGGQQTIISTGSFTVPTGVTTIEVEIWGGGGGSGGCTGATLNCGSTGAGAGYAKKLITGLTPGASIAVTIGAGGAGGVGGGAQPASGQNSSFGSFVSAGGGGAGVNGDASAPGTAPGSPGVGVGGDLNLTGGPGGTNWLSGSIAIVAAAAGTAPGMPPAQPNEGDIPGATAPNFGGAGRAASTNTGQTFNGGNGSGGLVVVRW